jgi:hypothetical protein
LKIYNQFKCHGVPPEQPARLDNVLLWARITQCARVYDTQAPQEVLRVVWIGNVFADAQPSALPVLELPHEILQRIAKPSAVADAECA